MNITSFCTLALCLCIIGLIELARESRFGHALALLGTAGAVLLGVAFQQQNWNQLILFALPVIIIGWLISSHNQEANLDDHGSRGNEKTL
ncbi:hypothetical protein [Desulforamulus hydrothermalis]|uniref:Uncharacterized protein n=1 Tax=Desulforamulus hydrothermalis Lam5 = DSM 18033 TaxID=1121428 RepID=K8E6I1_9FIRM|nr:hypothetical protein [Desulforamulus hydrothermalis]CCO07088.1 membrane hypothetical protein [Desulforamulus hydrothermalis Lam5 = DSM 18033]SHG90446.1 hypothetical protein SAMN02745177_00785 [Desulforamulus hydrothermalis Lam5 = DSM 18033]